MAYSGYSVAVTKIRNWKFADGQLKDGLKEKKTIQKIPLEGRLRPKCLKKH